MKISLVSSLFYPEVKTSGAVNYCFELAAALSKKHDVAVFAGTRIERPASGVFSGAVGGLKVTYFAQGRGVKVPPFPKRVFRYPALEKAFGEFLDAYGPDVVHFHALQQTLSVSLVEVARRKGVPVVFTLHDAWWLCPLYFYYQYYRKRLCGREGFFKCWHCYSRSSGAGSLARRLSASLGYMLRRRRLVGVLSSSCHCIVPSYFFGQKYRRAGVPDRAIAVLHNAVDTSHAQGSQVRVRKDLGILHLGFFCGTVEEKGFTFLTRALALLPDSCVCLHIWGLADERALDRARRSLRQNIVYHGDFDRPHACEAFGMIDVAVVPSRIHENCPVTILEAFAYRIPVIAADKGGIPELVTDGVNGLLFPYHDPGALAAAVKRFIDEPSLLGAISAGIGPVKDIAVQADEIAEMYSGLQGARSST